VALSVLRTHSETVCLLALAAAAIADPSQWYKSPEWILVIVGVVTAFVVGWQAYETRRAVSAQIVATNPFLVIKDWFTLVSSTANELHIQIDIVNTGKIPLILHGLTPTMLTQTIEIRDDTFIVPDQPYRAGVDIDLTADITEKLRGGGIMGFPLRGTINYSSDFASNLRQPFSGTLMIGPKFRTTFFALYNPTVSKTNLS